MTSTSLPIQIIRGLPFPDLPWFLKENIESGLDYTPNEGDIVISSYPKTGTTWLQYIVHQIVSKGDTPPSMDEMTYKIIPFIDMVGGEAIKKTRMYKHHLPYNVLKKNPKAKYLYIYRNPEDALVSYFHFLRNLTDEDIDFDEFYEGFMTGDIGYGRYFEHVLSYLSCEGDDNVLLISYEKLKSNTKEGILRIAKFIGEEYFNSIVEDEMVLKRILFHTSFEYMKNNLTLQRSIKGSNKNVNFFRKGNVGDGKKTLTTQQMKRLSDLMKELMKDTRVFSEWGEH